MKRRARLIALMILFAVGFFWVMGPSVGTFIVAMVQAQTPPPLPPIEIDTDNPLLLDTGSPEDEEPEPELFDPWAPPKPAGADNSSCLVCHKNFEKEEMVKEHAAVGVGCVKCHGKSDEHGADEGNVTPPDQMYAGASVRKMCQTDCHEEHDVPAQEIVARWLERCPEQTSAENLICTDCHGYHRLQFRTVRWNEETGELIIRKPSTESKNPEDTAESME